MKSNDKIPQDEMLLAEAIAAAKARGLGWCRDVMFEDADGNPIGNGRYGDAAKCCAYGALAIAGHAPFAHALRPDALRWVGLGNDITSHWRGAPEDLGESLGWAFRCAMEDA